MKDKRKSRLNYFMEKRVINYFKHNLRFKVIIL